MPETCDGHCEEGVQDVLDAVKGGLDFVPKTEEARTQQKLGTRICFITQITHSCIIVLFVHTNMHTHHRIAVSNHTAAPPRSCVRLGTGLANCDPVTLLESSIDQNCLALKRDGRVKEAEREHRRWLHWPHSFGLTHGAAVLWPAYTCR